MGPLDALQPHDFAIIERFERPWRLTTVEAREGSATPVTGGFVYFAATEVRLGARQEYTKNERLVMPSREGLDYLIGLSFQQTSGQAELRAVPRPHRRRLSELAQEVARITGVDLGVPADGVRGEG